MSWTAEEAAKATGGKATGNWRAEGVVIDSRILQEGDLYVAFKGERVDGHAFVQEAFAKGAAAAMVSDAQAAEGKSFLLVADTFKALEALGVAARARSAARILGITGSVGKTSTKEMLRMALEALGETFATRGNLNNHIGVPINLANLPASAKFGVFEMGMNHAGEIAALTRQVRPHLAIITGVEAAHLEFFASVDAIADAKAEIFEGLEPGGIVLLNRDNRYFDRLSQAAKTRGIRNIIGFGEHAEAQSRLLEYQVSEFGCEVVADILGTPVTYHLGAVGRHWGVISVAVLAAVAAMGCDLAPAAAALAHFREPEGRGRLYRLPVDNGYYTLIDDSYNANPSSMQGAFEKLAVVGENSTGGRSIAVLGNMLELGNDAVAMHKELAEMLKLHKIDLVFTAGELMKHLHDALPDAMRGAHAPTAEALLPLLRGALRPQDVVLAKGSHGSHIYQLSESLRASASVEN